MFLSPRYRPNKWPFYALAAIELPVTVALLALFGIAAPDLYRTRLWQDGADNGFNSNPNEVLYAAANYRPFTIPAVWSQFITNYNVVIVVLSMFFLLAKSVMYLLHVFPPILSVITHATLVALYAVSIRYQAGSDMSDPQHPQPGAPWYLTKPCSVAHGPDNVGYCKQAKAAFACTCIAMTIFLIQFGFGLWSCFPSKQHKAEREEELTEKKNARLERISQLKEAAHPLENLEAQASVGFPAESVGYGSSPTGYEPSHTGYGSSPTNPMTPRTLAFNRLGGTTDLPLRNHFSSPNAPRSPTYAPMNQEIGMPPSSPRNDEVTPAPQAPIYFPPPPTKAVKSK